MTRILNTNWTPISRPLKFMETSAMSTEHFICGGQEALPSLTNQKPGWHSLRKLPAEGLGCSERSEEW